MFGITGRKARVGGRISRIKALGSTKELRPILYGLRLVGGSGIPGVAVECVDIGRNTDGESGYLGQI